MLNLAVLLENSARDYPDRVAVVFQERRMTYDHVNRVACQVANGLANAGIRKGDKVALSCPNLPYFPIIYNGILKTGATVVPLNVLLKRREIAYHLTNSDAKVYLCFEGTEQLPMGEEGWSAFNGVPGCDHFWMLMTNPTAKCNIAGADSFSSFLGESFVFDTVQTDPQDTAVILYTSGTTGQPKGAELTHSNLVMNAWVSKDLIGNSLEDVSLVVLPLFHSFGQSCQMNAGFCAGLTLVLLPRFNPEAVFQALQDENVTLFCGVPTMYWDLLNYPEADKFDLDKIARTLRVGCSGGAAMPVDVMQRFEQRFGVQILEGYGLSETSPTASFNRRDRERRPGSIGLPVWGIEMRIVDDDMNDVPIGEPGEIVLRGHNIMKGYYKKPEATAEAFRGGWFHSGDVGKVDEDGYFYVVDRTKDMIIRGGFNVYPREIEEVLMSHPDISLAAVVGTPHEEYGEEIKAFLILRQGAEITADYIREWAKKEMAAYKYPRIIEICDKLPLGPTGKILKTELRRMERGG